MQFFDKIYILNLKKRKDRFLKMKKRLAFVEINNYEFFQSVDGEIMVSIFNMISDKNIFFQNSNYLATTLSHLSIYYDALMNKYKKILILEDDVKINVNIKEIFENIKEQIPENYDILYLGYIPLSDDLSMWNYNLIDKNMYISDNIFKAKNLWGLYAYSVSNIFMETVLYKYYKNEIFMELDRYFVNIIQPQQNSYGIIPQLFCLDNEYSDNTKRFDDDLLRKSVDTRYANYFDFI
jgi:GR25 family glycosyltransferase involved in LPS biosynthesis